LPGLGAGMIHPRVSAAVADLKATFGRDQVTHSELADGSVWVTLEGVDLGEGWAPRVVAISVKLAPTFPDTMPYPWYLPAALCRVDGLVVDRLRPVGAVEGIDRAQLSLGGAWSPNDSLGARVHGVIRWLRCQAPTQAKAS
jgi:hypothetical protein